MRKCQQEPCHWRSVMTCEKCGEIMDDIKTLDFKKIFDNLAAERDALKTELEITKRALELLCIDDERYESGIPWKKTYNRYINEAKEEP